MCYNAFIENTSCFTEKDPTEPEIKKRDIKLANYEKTKQVIMQSAYGL